MVFCVFVPRNPAVDTHDAVINIDKHIAQKPEIKENININRSADDARGIHPNIPFHGEKNTQQTEESSYNFQENLKKSIFLVRFYKKFIWIHQPKDKVILIIFVSIFRLNFLNNRELLKMPLEELWQLFPIKLVPHNTLWEKWFQEEKQHLETIINERVTISHIGSTAVPSIWAKPIIDILIECDDKNSLKNISDILDKNQYLCMSRDKDRMVYNKGYTMNGFAEKVFHLHIRLRGDNDELYFRDYLIENQDVAKEYEKMKLLLWKKFEHNRDAYTESKTDFVKKYTLKAKNIYGDRY